MPRTSSRSSDDKETKPKATRAKKAAPAEGDAPAKREPAAKAEARAEKAEAAERAERTERPERAERPERGGPREPEARESGREGGRDGGRESSADASREGFVPRDPLNRPAQQRVVPADRPREERPRDERSRDDRPGFDRAPQQDRGMQDRGVQDRAGNDRPQYERPQMDRPQGERPQGGGYGSSQGGNPGQSQGQGQGQGQGQFRSLSGGWHNRPPRDQRDQRDQREGGRDFSGQGNPQGGYRDGYRDQRDQRDQRRDGPREQRDMRDQPREQGRDQNRDQNRDQGRDQGRDQVDAPREGGDGPQGNAQGGGQGQSGMPASGGPQGQGGGDFSRDRSQQDPYGYRDRDQFRRGKKGKRRRGADGNFQRPGGSTIRAFDPFLPSDEDLEREAAELEKAIANADPSTQGEAISISQLQLMPLAELHKLAEREGFTDFHQFLKQDLIFKILKARAARQGLMFGDGTLEIMQDGFGFLRSSEQSFLPGPDDIYVGPTLIRKLGLRRGMVVKGVVRPPKENERYFAMLRADEVNGREPKKLGNRVNFEDLTPLHPEERYILETSPDEIECRVVDLVAPLGKGQRALIVAPPRTGKTVLLQKMTKAISKNYPKTKIIVLLVDERPEEVTDFRRNVAQGVEVVASTFDENSSRHVQVADMVIEKAKRMVELGEDVVIFLDSITRLARAYNSETSNSGRIMTGGLDANALQRPKKFFGAARAIEGGGSLTIIGTALVDTGSKMDEVIFEEFKGTGNSELHLDRKLMEKRIYPCIDIPASGTRREELLMQNKELELVHRLRKVLSDMNVIEAMELMKTKLKKVKTNAEFLMGMAMS